MKENILIKSERYNVSRIFLCISIISLILGVIAYCVAVAGTAKYDYFDKANSYLEALYFFAFGRSEYGISFGGSSIFPRTVFPAVIISAIFLVLLFAYSKISITVTDKRVYGNTIFGKQVDLPVDSISAVGSGIFKGISVSTASGRIVFSFIKNRDAVRNVITQLLNERQSKVAMQPAPVTDKISEADELKKYKELLDSGVITQEEFDAKKRNLLNL